MFIDGAAAELAIQRDTLAGSIDNEQPWRIGRRDDGLGFYGQLDELRILSRVVNDAETRAWFQSERVRGLLAIAPDKRDAKQKAALLDHYLELKGSEGSRAAHKALAEARKAEEKFRAELPKTLVMQELRKAARRAPAQARPVRSARRGREPRRARGPAAAARRRGARIA